MPKSRTATIGCTMRTLSHNLALLPPPHKASAFWFRAPLVQTKNTKPLNMLLVPLPYEIEASDFECLNSPSSYPPEFDRWGEFDLKQTWLTKDKPYLTVTSLLQKAKDKGAAIEGIILPEYALNWQCYNELVQELRKSQYDSVKFLVSGSSEEPLDDGGLRRGNFVLTTMFYEDTAGKRMAVTSCRGKHHRWRLDRTQVEAYGLDNVLDANTFWWENIDIADRKIVNMVFREHSVFSALICEDLARSEPVHSVLQSIGPNLVFVLLMDGPQLRERWAARNATGLTEDPGSSVLTFTSRALPQRQSARKDGYGANYTIALWKDDTQRIREIICDPEKDEVAAIVTLSAARVRETTLDGRSNSDAWSWRMSGYETLKK